MAAPMTPVQLALRTRSRGRRRRVPRMLPPIALERIYQRLLRSYVQQAKEALEKHVLPALPGLVNEANANRPARADAMHLDETLAEQVARLFNATRSSLEGSLSERELQSAIGQVAGQVSSFNREQLARVFRAIVGVDIFAAEPALGAVTEGFIAENLALVRNVSDQFLAQAQQTIYRGFRQGTRWEEIAAQLTGADSRFSVAESRAELIARDQINKLNGQLAQYRQQQAGVAKYVWRTAGDSRVRPEHEDREGKTFSWDDPPSDGHPGEPINCRCTAEPVIEIE